jgi:hypothetical protein
MLKSTWNEFIYDLKSGNDIAFLGSTWDKSNDYIKDIIDNRLSEIEINYNRKLNKITSSSIKFDRLDDGKVETSSLNRTGTVYTYKGLFIINNDKSHIIYKISDKNTLNFNDLIEKQKQEQELARLQKIKDDEAAEQKKKDDFKKELESYFNHKYWDKEKTSKLTPLQFGRVKKSLEKQYRYDGIVRSVKENIEFNTWDKKEIGKAYINWKHYDKLCDWAGNDTEESRAYKKRIENKKIYELYYSDKNGTYTEIPKIVYDLLINDFDTVPGATNPGLEDDIVPGATNPEKSIGEAPTNFSKREFLKMMLKKYNKQKIKVVEKIDPQFAGVISNGSLRVVFDTDSDYLIIEDTITKDNIALYYEFMDDEDLEKHKDILSVILCQRRADIVKIIDFENHSNITLDNTMLKTIKWECFGIKDNLKPIDEYIEEIKGSSEYKEYIESKGV